MSEQDSRQTRRRFLTTSAALGASLAVAGCSGGSGEGTATGNNSTSNETDMGTDSMGTGTDSGSSGGSGDAASISYGSEETYTLEEGDGTDPEYEGLALPVTFEGSSGDEIVVEMTSEFDTLVVLEGPNDEVVAENDDGEGMDDYNSRLEYTLEQDGTYTIWCTSYSGTATGEFNLLLEQA